MAEEKKPGKKPEVKPESKFQGKTHFDHTLMMLVVLMLLGYLLTRFEAYLYIFDSSSYASYWGSFMSWLWEIWHAWKGISVVVAILCAVWWLYSYLKLEQIKKDEEKIFGREKGDPDIEEIFAPKPLKNEKWVKVLEHMNSTNSADWRLAIIEADIMLDETLRAKGYPGDGVGEMLKSVGPNDLTTLDAAWEAHKVRNRIAHSGSDFQLNERETKRVISLFEAVFKELGVI